MVSHLRIALVCAVMLVVSTLGMHRMERPVAMTDEVHLPRVQAAFTIQVGLHRASAALGGWIALKDEELRAARALAWEEEIRPSLATLGELARLEQSPIHIERQAELEKMLGRLADLQQWTEEVAAKPGNEPARLVLIEELRPLAEEFRGHIDALLDAQTAGGGVTGSAGIADLLALQLALAKSDAALGRFVIESNPADEAEYRTQWASAAESYDGILAAAANGPAPQALLDEVAVCFDRYGGLAESVIESRKSPRSNVAWNTVETKLQPLELAIAGMLEEITGNEAAIVRSLVSEVSSSARFMTVGMVVMLSLMIVIALFLSYSGARQLSAPITMLADAARHLAQGEFRESIKERGAREIRNLIAAFNKMHEAIRRSHANLREMAYTDALTGLANRKAFNDRIGGLPYRSQRETRCKAVAMVDLDHFKEINDSMGHDAGDYLIAEFATRLQSSLRDGDLAARVGGDEFAVLLSSLASPEDAEEVMRRVQAEATRPLEHNWQTLHPSCTIGIAVAEAGDEDAGELLKNADLALYEAKQHKRGTIRVYAESMRRSIARARLIGKTVSEHPFEEVFAIHYQPYFELASGRVTGLEALLRWRHSVCEPCRPDEFIPVLEHSGAIEAVTRSTLMDSCRQLERWHALTGDPGLCVSVNISASLLAERNLPDMVHQAVTEAGVPRERLFLEVTETSAMEDPERSLRIMQELERLGVHFAIDDFGTGHSSLAYLKRMPLSILKIDRGFVAGMLENEADARIVEATIRLSHALGLEVIAEGIETREQAAALATLGCDLGQGFLFARPRPAAEIDNLLLSRGGTAPHLKAVN